MTTFNIVTKSVGNGSKLMADLHWRFDVTQKNLVSNIGYYVFNLSKLYLESL